LLKGELHQRNPNVPTLNEDLKLLTKYGEVRKVPLLTKPFVAFPVKGDARFYGEKVHLCETDDPEVVFLDCDSYLIKRIDNLFELDFDFAARPAQINYLMNWDIWNTVCKRHNRKSLPIIGANFMLFKNYTHKKIFRDWLKFLDYDYPDLGTHTFLKEQYALTLALSEYNIHWLKKELCVWEWNGERVTEDTVFVARAPKEYFLKKLKNKVNKEIC